MTIDDRAQRLLNAELDGELSAGDRRELDARLAVQPELRREREALQGLARRLRDVPDLEPPADLARRVVAAVELSAPSRLRWRFPRWAPNPLALPFAALAAGLTVAVVTFWPPPGAGPDNLAGMVGSMVRDQSRAGAEQPGKLVVAVEAVTGQVTLGSPVGGERVLEFELKSANPVDIAVNLDESGLGFDGFARTGTGVELIATAAGTLRLRSQGESSFAVRLRGADTVPAAGLRLELAVSEREKELYRGVLTAR